MTLQPVHLYRTALLLFALALAFRFFQQITDTLLLVFAAALVAVLLNPLVHRLSVHRRWVAAGTGVLLLLTLGAAVWFGVPALGDQLRALALRGPEFEARLQGWADQLREQTGLNVAVVGEGTARSARGLLQAFGTQEVFGRARGVLEMILIPFVVVIGGLYALANPNSRLLLPLVRIVPPARRAAWYRILDRLGERLFGWIRGTVIAMVTVGALTCAALYLIGVPYWLLLGTVVGLTEFIPIFGPWIGGVPAVTVAFLDEPTKGLWTAVAILAIQQLESWVITPWAMSHEARIHPLVTLFALILFGSVFGVMGVILALPLVILIWTVVEVLWVEETLGADRDAIPPVVEE